MTHSGNDLDDFLICPNCNDNAHLAILSSETTVIETFNGYYTLVEGWGACTSCTESDYDHLSGSIRQKPLDFHYKYTTIDDIVKLSPTTGEPIHYNRGDYCMCILCDREREANSSRTSADVVELVAEPQVQENHLYAVMCGNSNNRALVQLFSDRYTATQIADRDSMYFLDTVDLDGEIDTRHPFKVHVVSVGSESDLRYPLFTTDLQCALKMATSIKGRISSEIVMPNHNNCIKETRMAKWFIRLEGDSEVYSVDTIRRRTHVSKNGDQSPFITLRRRYSNSLPHRLEVTSCSGNEAQNIANNLRDNYNNDELIAMCEYNVDYDVYCENGDWLIQPRLLEAIGVDDENPN